MSTQYLQKIRVESTEPLIDVEHAAEAARARRMTQRVLTPVDLEWKTDTFDPRRTSALLTGDPARPGPYTVRFHAPAGYEIGLHMHPDDDEQLTVLSGTVVWSTGEAGSGAREYTLGPGGFALAPAGTPHRVRALEDTVLQMSGMGPRAYTYLGGAETPALNT